MRGGWIVVGFAVACAGKRVPDDVAQLAAALARADAAWDARAEGDLIAVEEALDSVPASRHDDPAVRWRRARLWEASALATDDPTERLRGLARARAEALGCVMDDVQVEAAWETGGWDAAGPWISGERRRCLLEGASAWSRWLVRFGGTPAALDAETLKVVLPMVQTQAPARVGYLRALVEVAGAHEDTQVTAANELRPDARTDDGRSPWLVYDDRREAGLPAERPTTPALTPEDRGAERRATAALTSGDDADRR